jgi:HPt (histidine-containing phosphotransfer) domain-containing protein
VPDLADPAVDQAVIAEVLESTGGDREFLGELIGTYLDDVPRQLAALREAASAGSADGVARAAHALKGASASLGAVGLAERSRVLELAARAGRIDDAGDQIGDLEAEFQRVAGALRSV